MSTILVTGGSGFVGSHCILQLLAAGHQVRTTIRNLAREAEVRAMLAAGGAAPDAPLAFCAADLEKDEGWAEAVAGCDYVLHVASPFPAGVPKHEDELIIPAREGTLRVLRAARDAGVKRVVLTSSFAAVGYGRPTREAPFTEADWTNVDAPETAAYQKSKTLAERAAWDFIAAEGNGLELSAVNPTGIFGPVLGKDFATSIMLVQRMLAGQVPAAPRFFLAIVDVRDVADLHLRAMTAPEAAGERFLATTGPCLSMHQIARILRRGAGEAGRKAPRFQVPDWLVRLAAKRDPALRAFVPQLGLKRDATPEKAKRMLGWQPRSAEDAILATAESLTRLGIV